MRVSSNGVSLRGPGASASGCYSGAGRGSALSTLSLLFAMGVGWRQTTTMACVVGIFAAALLGSSWTAASRDHPFRQFIRVAATSGPLRAPCQTPPRVVRRYLGKDGRDRHYGPSPDLLFTSVSGGHRRLLAVVCSGYLALRRRLLSGGGYIASMGRPRKGAHGDVAASAPS